MIRIIAEFPYSLRPRHDVQVVHIISGRRGYRMVALRHHNSLAVFDRHRFVQRTVIGVDPLNGKTAFRLNPEIVGFLQQRLLRQLVAVMLVRRVAGPVAPSVNTSTTNRLSAGFCSGKILCTRRDMLPLPRFSTPTSSGAMDRPDESFPGARHTASSISVRAVISYGCCEGT